jgi:hypothetical protein
MSFTKMLVSIIGIVLPSIGLAQIRDGDYEGSMQCGPLLTNPTNGAWTQPIKITASSNSLTWLRSDARFSEKGSGILRSGRVSLTLDGAWNPGEKNTGHWRTVAMLNLEGSKLSGPATLFSDKDNQRLRDCTVSADVNASPSSFPQVASTPPLVSSLKEAGKVVLQAQEKMTGQAVNGIKTTTAAAVGAVGAVTGIAQSGVETPPPANSNAGKLFNSKAELLQKTRSGQYLNLYRFTSDETVEFASSVLTVLASEYGVKNWPTERAMVNGAAISRMDSACKGEFEANVRNLFGETARAYANTLDDRPPMFINPNRTIQNERRSVDQAVAQLPSQQGGWCSGKSGLHPYLTAMPKLLAEFDGATALAVDDKRNQLRAAYQQKQAQEAAIAQANQQAKQVQAAQRAEAERQAKEKELSVRQQREAYEKGAAVRNAQKIKAIGLPSDFLASTLYVNYMGQWSAFMPCAQWVGLLLENRKIASVEAISMRGYPGVSIKRVGQPAMGLLFRMEGKEAYAYAIVANGRAEPIQSPADHSQIALLLKVLTSEKELN